MKSGMACTFALLAAISAGCRVGGSFHTILQTPRFVPQSVPDTTVDQGIGMDPATGGISLEWYSVPGAAGYKLFRSDSSVNRTPGDFTLLANVGSLSSFNDTAYVDNAGLHNNQRYFYYLLAYSADGVESGSSDTANYVILQRPVISFPGQNDSVHASHAQFYWFDPTAGGYTVIKVKDVTQLPEEYTWVSHLFSSFSPDGNVQYDFDGTATASLQPGHRYMVRVDRVNVGANEGARSAWRGFYVEQ